MVVQAIACTVDIIARFRSRFFRADGLQCYPSPEGRYRSFLCAALFFDCRVLPLVFVAARLPSFNNALSADPVVKHSPARL
ncbi:hypothetical protein DQW77_01500 [Roseovarius sp. TE539]|nr:hypothetical protein DQW77_01500 [Roseovarius sp. TE539]